MGGRTALSRVVSSEVMAILESLLGVDFQFNLNGCRFGLSRMLPSSVQSLIYSFARRPYVLLAEPTWSWSFPRSRSDPLAEFGAWCAVGCPVFIDGRLVRTRLDMDDSNTERVFRIDSI